MCAAARINRTAGCRRGSGGYTLLEAVIALAVWSVITLAASGVLVYASRASARMLYEHEYFENTRAALDAITANIHMADTVVIENDYDGVLRKLTLTERDPDGYPANYIFYFNASAQPGEAKYHRLEFGLNNEFASHIRRITVTPSGDGTLTVAVTSDDALCPAVALTAMVDVRYKRVSVV